MHAPYYSISPLDGLWHIRIEMGNHIVLTSFDGTNEAAHRHARREINRLIITPPAVRLTMRILILRIRLALIRRRYRALARRIVRDEAIQYRLIERAKRLDDIISIHLLEEGFAADRRGRRPA